MEIKEFKSESRGKNQIPKGRALNAARQRGNEQLMGGKPGLDFFFFRM